MPKMPGGGMPQMKDVRIDIERDQITLMANMGGMALPMTLEAKEMKKICFRPCKIKKLFKEVDSEEVVFTMEKMPRLSMPGGPGGGMPGGMPQMPADKQPEIVIQRNACGKEFDAYKSLLERFAMNNHIPFEK